VFKCSPCTIRGANCDIDHYFVVANVREILAVNKQAAQTFDVGRFNIKKLGKREVRQEFRTKISERFTALQI
jgi:hypothetical protein